IIAVELVRPGNVPLLIMLVVAGIDKHDQPLLVLRVAKKLVGFLAINWLQAFRSEALSHGVPDCHGGGGTGRSRYLPIGGRGGVVRLPRRGQGWVNGSSAAFGKIIPRQRQAAGRNRVRHQREGDPERGNK